MSQLIKASFDTETKEGKMRFFNAKTGASESLKNLEDGHVLKVTDALIYEDEIDTYGNKQTAKISVLFEEDGTAYASVSETVYKATEELIGLIESGITPLNVRITKAISGKGNEFLNLQLVM